MYLIFLFGVLMPETLMRCFLKVKKRLRKDHKNWSSQRTDRVARAICVKSTGQKFVKHDAMAESMFNITFGESGTIKGLEFQFQSEVKFIEREELEKFRPAVEINDPDSILSVGKAIWATDSVNFNRYEEIELRRAADSLKGKPCQIDHNESSLFTMGVVQDSWWDRGIDPAEIAYVSELEGSNEVAQKVKKGYVRFVSVAGVAEQILCTICGEDWSWAHEHFPGETYEGETCYRNMKKIKFRHLGFTNFPGIEGADTQYVPASLDEAVENAFAYVDYLGWLSEEEEGWCEDDDQYDEKKLSTKARKGLPDSSFAIPRLRALPLDTCNRVRNAMARWNQVKDATDAEKASAKRKILAKARSCGIDVDKFAKNDAGVASFLAFGETISMSSEEQNTEILKKLKLFETSEYERAKLIEEKAKLEAKILEMEKDKADADKDLADLKEAERSRLISEIVDLQDKLELTKGRKPEERRADLAEEHMLSLKAKVEALREMWDREDKASSPPRSLTSEGISAGQSRSIAFKGGSRFGELDPEKKAFYEREAKLERYAIGLFNRRPSVGAVQTLSEWDDTLDRWKTDFADMFKSVPKLETLRENVRR